MTAYAMSCAAVLVAAGLAGGWFFGWARGFRTGIDDERARWIAWIMPKESKDMP